MIIEYPEHDTWFVKINIGFNGCHTAVYKFHNTSVSHINKDEMSYLLDANYNLHRTNIFKAIFHLIKI